MDLLGKLWAMQRNPRRIPFPLRQHHTIATVRRNPLETHFLLEFRQTFLERTALEYTLHVALDRFRL